MLVSLQMDGWSYFCALKEARINTTSSRSSRGELSTALLSRLTHKTLATTLMMMISERESMRNKLHTKRASWEHKRRNERGKAGKKPTKRYPTLLSFFPRPHHRSTPQCSSITLACHRRNIMPTHSLLLCYCFFFLSLLREKKKKKIDLTTTTITIVA